MGMTAVIDFLLTIFMKCVVLPWNCNPQSQVAEQPCITLFDRDINLPVAVMPTQVKSTVTLGLQSLTPVIVFKL